MALPLEGIRVLDFGRYVAGPYCAALLAEFGADVIRVDKPGGSEDRFLAPVTSEGEGALFVQVNRGKRSVTLDPATPDGKASIRKLVEGSDVVVVNLPPQSVVTMGLDYASLSAIKPDIILVNLSAFGQEGEWRDRPGFDSIGQAMSGALYMNGPSERPYRAQTSWVDFSTASLAAFGTMVALHERAKSGKGQEVNGALLATAATFSASPIAEQVVTQQRRERIGNRSYYSAPVDVFATADGWILLQVTGLPLFKRFARLIGHEEWLEDPRFADDLSRANHADILCEAVEEWTRTKTSQEALDALARASIPAGLVMHPQDVPSHPAIKALDLFQDVAYPNADEIIPVPRVPVYLSRTPGRIGGPPPRVGQHNDEILGC